MHTGFRGSQSRHTIRRIETASKTMRFREAVGQLNVVLRGSGGWIRISM